jgi:hypothetical protein
VTRPGSDAAAEALLRQRRDVDRERALVDLDESIAAREQAIANREQERLDAAQRLLDDDRVTTAADAFTELAVLRHRQAALDRAQDRRGARQHQLDDAHAGRATVQRFLDEQAADIAAEESGRHAAPAAIPTELNLASAARHRDVAAATRAEDADRRTVEDADLDENRPDERRDH